MTHSAVRIVDSADVSSEATLGEGSSIWHLAQVREGVRMGRNCIVGFTSHISTRTEIVTSVAEAFVTELRLIQWIDVGQGTP